MTNDQISISVKSRMTGKGISKANRKEKMIPAVIYGPKLKANINCKIDQLTVERFGTAKHESTVFVIGDSEVKEAQSLRVLFKNVAYEPSTNKPMHVDLYALDMTGSIRVPVEIKLMGTSIGVKEQGGLLNQTLRELEIECAANSIPDHIEVDVSELNLNDSLHVSDLKLPSGVKAMTAPERTIVTVNAPKEEKVEEPVAAAPEGEAAPAGEAPKEG